MSRERRSFRQCALSRSGTSMPTSGTAKGRRNGPLPSIRCTRTVELDYVDENESHAYMFRLVTAFVGSLVPKPQILGRADYGLLEALAACAANLSTPARRPAGTTALRLKQLPTIRCTRYQRKLTTREKWLTDKRRACLIIGRSAPCSSPLSRASTPSRTWTPRSGGESVGFFHRHSRRPLHPGAGLLSVVEPDTAQSVFLEAIAAEWPALKPFVCLEEKRMTPAEVLRADRDELAQNAGERAPTIRVVSANRTLLLLASDRLSRRRPARDLASVVEDEVTASAPEASRPMIARWFRDNRMLLQLVAERLAAAKPLAAAEAQEADELELWERCPAHRCQPGSHPRAHERLASRQRREGNPAPLLGLGWAVARQGRRPDPAELVPDIQALNNEFYTPLSVTREAARLVAPLLADLWAWGTLFGLEPSAGIGRFVAAFPAVGGWPWNMPSCRPPFSPSCTPRRRSQTPRSSRGLSAWAVPGQGGSRLSPQTRHTADVERLRKSIPTRRQRVPGVPVLPASGLDLFIRGESESTSSPTDS